jgi:hypothetical protein
MVEVRIMGAPLPAENVKNVGKINIASACLLAGQSPHGANERCDLAPAGYRFSAIAAMLEGVPVTLRSTRVFHHAPAKSRFEAQARDYRRLDEFVAELTYENRHDETRLAPGAR